MSRWGYTVAVARAGFRATGVEARVLNIAKFNNAGDGLQLENPSFVEADVRS